jgi:alanine racemase
MTHLCCAEVAGAATTAASQERFTEALAEVAAAGLKPGFVHIGNSSAVDEGSTMAWVRQQAKKLGARAMVRTGLALYGYCLPLEGAKAGRLRSKVKPVLTWKARVLGVREVKAGTTVGYGATFVAERTMRLALLAAGYADGFRREASSGLGDGWVMLNGKRAPVVGRVSMNLTTVDVTEIEGVSEGMEATLLGEGISAEDHARWAETIPYEILCGIRGLRELR